MKKWTGLAKKARNFIVFVIAILAVLALYAYNRIPQVGNVESHKTPVALDWPATKPDIDPANWQIFRSSVGGAAQSAPGPISANYRLAGTFLEYGDPSGNYKRSRKAILDDLKRDYQALVEEGDTYQDLSVVRISKDHILLEKDGVEEELWLSFSSEADDESEREDAEKTMAQKEAEETVLESSRFGKRVGETRWVFQKEALRDFYDEMMDNPARAVDIYETMRPNYDADENIKGYTVDMVGEKDFFDAVGLQNGDLVRRVNSMEMTSRGRAEYFMKEFMKDRINAVVLDIERDDEKKKLIYLLR